MPTVWNDTMPRPGEGIAPGSQRGAGETQVRADKDGLREILDNLIDNAIKYNNSGGTVTISWSTRRRF